MREDAESQYSCGTYRLLSPVTSSPPMLRRALSEEGITEIGVPEAEGSGSWVGAGSGLC